MSADATLQFTRDYQNRIPFVAHLGLTTDALGAGTARLSMPLPAHFTNSLGTAHGGVIMSLLDDIPIMTIAYDHTPVSPKPIRWQICKFRLQKAMYSA